jgi:hypothetical protein
MKLQSVWTKKKSEIFDVSFLLPFMLLYRKENSESDSYCRHNVRSSRLFLSRRKWNPLIFLPRISKSTPCKGILTFFLFSKIENVEYFYKHLVFDPFGLALRSTHSMLIAIWYGFLGCPSADIGILNALRQSNKPTPPPANAESVYNA